MTIDVYSFDFDNCLFNKAYQASADRNIIAANSVLFETIKKSTNKKRMFIGSNRQSLGSDFENAQHDMGSCFPAAELVADELGAKLDPFLMTDLYNDLTSGTTFNHGKTFLSEDGRNYAEDKLTTEKRQLENKGKFYDWIHDSGKLSLIYAQILKVAHDLEKKYPNEPIVFHFIDDRDDILEGLHKHFSNHAASLPSHVTLKLKRYQGGIDSALDENYLPEKDFQEIQGTGTDAHKNYKQKVKDIVDSTIKNMVALGHDILSAKLGSLITSYKEAEEHKFQEVSINFARFYAAPKNPTPSKFSSFTNLISRRFSARTPDDTLRRTISTPSAVDAESTDTRALHAATSSTSMAESLTPSAKKRVRKKKVRSFIDTSTSLQNLPTRHSAFLQHTKSNDDDDNPVDQSNLETNKLVITSSSSGSTDSPLTKKKGSRRKVRGFFEKALVLGEGIDEQTNSARNDVAEQSATGPK